MADPKVNVTTNMILSLAYCTIFGCTINRGDGIGQYYGQYAGDSCIDYASFNGHSAAPFDEDFDYFEAAVEDGSEGCWIRIDLVHDVGPRKRVRVGTIKTLDEGRKAWKNMGALAGELAWMANYDAAPKVIERAKKHLDEITPKRPCAKEVTVRDLLNNNFEIRGGVRIIRHATDFENGDTDIEEWDSVTSGTLPPDRALDHEVTDMRITEDGYLEITYDSID